jgi:sensitive to high expression protein 9
MSLVLRHFWKGWQEELLPLITQNFNDMTGYTQVLKAKEKVTQADQHLTQFKQSLADSKAQVDQLVDQRRKTQLQINTLLQRKDAWTDLDIERFTELYRSDLSLDVDEQKAKQGYTKASEDFEKAHTLYLK